MFSKTFESSEIEDFFMSAIAVHSNNNSRIGTCPHGLPQGACPICSGMGGSGAKKADFSAKPGEMSWNECAAIGAMLKAQKNAKIQRQKDADNFAFNARVFQNGLMNASQRLANIGGFFLNNLPAVVAKPANFILSTIIGGSLRFAANIPQSISNFVQAVGAKFVDISDKLTAMMGELKNSVDKTLSNLLSGFKKKIKSLFSIFQPLDIDNDDKQIEETKRTFELRTFIHDLYRKITQNKKDLEENDN